MSEDDKDEAEDVDDDVFSFQKTSSKKVCPTDGQLTYWETYCNIGADFDEDDWHKMLNPSKLIDRIFIL